MSLGVTFKMRSGDRISFVFGKVRKVDRESFWVHVSVVGVHLIHIC